MNKKEQEKLDKKFQAAFKKASDITEKLPQDVMLNFYAYYKQATNGDSFPLNTNYDVRNAFKLNAWMQLKGTTQNEAKKKYIELVKEYTKQKQQ